MPWPARQQGTGLDSLGGLCKGLHVGPSSSSCLNFPCSTHSHSDSGFVLHIQVMISRAGAGSPPMQLVVHLAYPGSSSPKSQEQPGQMLKQKANQSSTNLGFYVKEEPWMHRNGRNKASLFQNKSKKTYVG